MQSKGRRQVSKPDVIYMVTFIVCFTDKELRNKCRVRHGFTGIKFRYRVSFYA